MTLRLVSNKGSAIHKSSAVSFISEFKQAVVSGEIKSFAVVGITQDGGFSVRKSIQQEDQEDMLEVLEHLKFLINIEINE